MSNEILIIAFLLLLNAFFALSEMAIVSSSKPLLRQYAKQGKKGAQAALDLAENPGRFLSTVQVGITLVGILAGAYGGATIAEKLKEPFNQIELIAPHGETLAVMLVVGLITYFSVVVGELVPKQLALNNSEKFAMLVAPLMKWVSKICTPIVLVLELSARFLMIVMRIKPRDEGVTETEITAMIAEGVVSGAIEGEEHDVIRRVIRLGDRDVKSIMTHRTDVSFIDVDDSFDDVCRKIAEAGHSRYPVIDKDKTHVLGFVKAKQMLSGYAKGHDFNVRDYMHDVLFVNENTSCLDVLGLFRRKSLHIAAVIDEYGTFDGLFTTSDLLEAIVGMMPSNYDHDEGPLIVQREDGSWLVDGLTPIEEIHMVTGIEDVPADDDYETIAGFVMMHLRGSLAAGMYFEFKGYRFEIVDMDGLRIDKVLITRTAMPGPEA
ncbi:hemolysin family protein [Micavibrio aeruginosavorus]|uniref:Hemolysins-related proteins containing CBS domains n=1 Tax=Micavibrio aeruginosavorus EPB TaxID=349215 RepID=M4W0E8_9BACT|nr:hemolysin family protein [Micavibrio aeruginosavorus]AGH98914.1 Hemolysins-related proteins containing CBS domains [Micavibrio aeruginosavorus EPB]